MKDFLYPLRALHGRLHDWYTDMWPFYRERIQNPNAVYLVLTPEHGNLGDHAIAQAEVEILQEQHIPYIEVTGRQLCDWKEKNILHVMNGRPILINGGGNLGTLWPDVEEIMREIVRQNPKSSILILPNTIYYEEDENGRRELQKSIEIYNAHHHLKLYARENTSYVKMKESYSSVALVPDMVLRMNKCKSGLERKGCILCLRSDREKTRSEAVDSVIKGQTASLFGDEVKALDMVVPHPIPLEERDQELEKQYDAFRHAELVITDRLHGMIFCAITGTPCIVINSKSPKVRGCYEWIKELEYIQFCDDVSQIRAIYQTIPKREWNYDNSMLLPLYETLEQDILKVAKRKS